MSSPSRDERSAARRAADEKIAAEPLRAPVDVPAGAPVFPLEEHLNKIRRKPMAVEGVVENGVVRPVDSSIRLPEHARVIIVAPEAA